MGPDGASVHSWRVAILPFLGDEARRLHDRYNFREPWDSPHNEKLLTEMPDAFRHPLAPADSTHASYFALTGPHTVFPADGSGFAQIIDGTSNTILLVEAKREIAWTRPEDIPVKPGEPPPQLGGFFEGGYSVVAADGAPHFLPYRLDRATLEKLIARNDGMPVDWRGEEGR